MYRSQGNNYYWDEQQSYGSSRTGTWNWNNALPSRAPVTDASNPTITDSLMLGSRSYELSNHLGNVLAVISDKKIGVANTSTPALVDYYKAEVLTQNDYYPFGMQMPGRNFTVGSAYHYGFNGKEKDNEVKNKDGSQLDYGFRIYDTRLGRFLSVDPITSKYPELTPYQFASNRPVDGIDMDGLEYVKFSDNPVEWIYQFGQGFFKGEGGVYNLVDGLNRNANPVGIVAHGTYGATTGKDLITQTPVNRTTAFTDMVVNGVMLASGEKLLAGLTAESQLSKQMALNKNATAKASSNTVLKVETNTASNVSGSGPKSGILEVSQNVKSVGAFKNYNPKNPIEFVYDPLNQKFLVGQPNQSVPGLSGHQQLVKAGGLNSENVVGGMFKRGSNGEIITNEYSGHYYKNWTDPIRKNFQDFIENQTGQKVSHKK